MDLSDNDAVTMTSPPPTSSSPMEFLPSPPLIQNCLICSEIVEVIENSEKNRKIGEIFCRVSCRYLNIKIGNFNPPERTLSVHSNVINEDNCGILCENCFPLAESFCKIYNKFQYLEQLFHFRIKESIDRIRIQMEKCLDDHEDDHDDESAEMESEELNREKRSRSQIDFRQKFVMRGKQKLSESVPILLLDRQGLGLDSEAAETKIAINFLEGSSEAPEEDFLLDPLDIKTEQEFDNFEEESHNSGLSYWCEICDMEFTRISDFQRHRKSCGSESIEENTEVKHGERHGKSFCCKFCGKSFPQFGNLQVHERTHTGARPYKCRFCDRTFPSAGSRTKHERIHTGSKPYECAICGQKFRHSHSLTCHGNSQHPGQKFRSDRRTESGFKCGLCDKFFATVKLQLAHERSHAAASLDPLEINAEEEFVEFQDDKKETSSGNTVAKPYKCRFCKRTFSLVGNRNQHEQIHSGAMPYKCRFCERKFTLLGNRDKHERVHSDAMAYECAICGQKFRQSKSLNFHGDSKHPGEKFWSKSQDSESYFKCDICFKAFATLEHKLNHERSHSSTSSSNPFTSIPTPTATTATSTSTSVTEKKKIRKKANSKAKNIISLVCEICGKSFDHKSLLKTHMRSHGGPEPFQCKFCGKTFAMKGNLNQHERIHSDEKPFECAICGKKFRYIATFKDHGRSMHPGEKFRNTETFKCSVCDLEFKQLGHKVNHERSHRNKEAFPYECKICHRIFRQAKQLQQHEIKNHGNQSNAPEATSSQSLHDAVEEEPGDGDASEEGNDPFVKVENSSSPKWNDEEMEAALDAAFSIY